MAEDLEVPEEPRADATDPGKAQVQERDGHSPFPIVAIGASAGGLEAFRQFLGVLPVDSGMAFLLVQHLAPQHESRLIELLARATKLPVSEAAQGMRVEPDHVYLIPPNSDMAVSQGVLQVTTRGDGRGPHLPIDFLFRSLAEEQQSRAIGVVLSGTGSDGTLGLAEIKAVGGLTFAQDDQSAIHPGMPSSARVSGCVDFVLPPDEIAKRLVDIGNHPYLAPPGQDGEKLQEPDDYFRRILATVRQVMGVDFSLYRSTTIRRRIMRRMALHGQQSLDEYIRRLEKDRDEVDALYHDLLINVTSFFRDPEVFEALKEVVFPQLIKDKPPSEPFRIWVPGCSTGQEAYSIAIALLEFFDSRPVRPSMQIFATDLSDQTSLEKARAGIYPESIEAEVSPERLRRFFKKEDHVYRIDKSIRDQCVFARQNVTADPPFSHLDLISCRNVLIYLGNPLQRRVLPTFHYALDIPGFLVLGAAESIGDHNDLFDLVDRAHKIYSKRPAPPRPLLPFAEDYRALGTVASRRPAASQAPTDFQKEADRILLGRFAPPAVLVNQNLDIVQFRGRTSAYLEAPPGEPTANVMKMAREGLFLELRSALSEVKKSGKGVRRKGLRMVTDTTIRDIELEILPVRPPGDDVGCFLIVFHEADPKEREASIVDGAGPTATGPTATTTTTNAETQHLRQELVATKEYLQSLAEQQDAANEELRSANEEILSSNEELQSTNEELETAKEELQSANEELTTVNEQLQHRNIELTQVNNDLTNLLSSTNMPLVMVGSDLRIRRFTTAAKRILRLLPTDLGRPIGDIRASFDFGELDALVSDVIESVQPLEREVRDGDGCWFNLRISPYRTSDNRIDGAVIVMIDVDQLRRNQEELERQAGVLRQQAALIELSHDAIIVRDADNRVLYWNQGAAEMYGHSVEQARGKRLDELLEMDESAWTDSNAALDSAGSWEGELHQWDSDGHELLVHSREILIRDAQGARSTVLSIQRDVTETKRALSALKRADRQKDLFLATLAHELRNPIAPIRNAVEIMRLAEDDPKAIEKVRDVLERQVRQLAGIVEDLVDVSRIIERKIELHRRVVSIESMVKTAVDTSRPLIESCGHELEVELPDEEIHLHADPVRVSQILVNLLNNAAKFTPTGGRISLTVEALHGPAGGHEVVIRVRDTGMGISEDIQARIFEMFSQGDGSPLHGTAGLGVGLTLVRSLAQMHGGSVDVFSEGLGRGSEFIVRLPAVDPSRAIPETPPPPPPKKKAAVKRKILIVDDNHDQADSLAKLLELMGHDVRLTYDGESALKIASKFRPDIGLIDIGLPKLNGYEVAEKIRKDPNLESMLLVAQTGWGQEEDRRRTKAAGFDYHFVKPVDIDELRRILAEPRKKNGR